MFNRLFDRKGRTDILIPSIGVPAKFGEIRAGDFFSVSFIVMIGRLLTPVLWSIQIQMGTMTRAHVTLFSVRCVVMLVIVM